MNETNVGWKELIKAICALILLFSVVIFTARYEQKVVHNKLQHVNVDSILNTNDSIKIVIKYIDSDEEIEKVLKLDNDSTLELFKQLVRE